VSICLRAVLCVSYCWFHLSMQCGVCWFTQLGGVLMVGV